MKYAGIIAILLAIIFLIIGIITPISIDICDRIHLDHIRNILKQTDFMYMALCVLIIKKDLKECKILMKWHI